MIRQYFTTDIVAGTSNVEIETVRTWIKVGVKSKKSGRIIKLAAIKQPGKNLWLIRDDWLDAFRRAYYEGREEDSTALHAPGDGESLLDGG